MVGAPESDGAQYVIRIGGEIPIGEKQKFDELHELLTSRNLYGIYVNHVDIFWTVQYRFASIRNIKFRFRLMQPSPEEKSMAIIPFDQRDGFIWMNGEFVPWREAKVHVLTHALHYASAVFEGERAYGGVIFKLREHTERLFMSAEMLDMKIPYSIAEIDEACRAALKKQGFTDAYVRPIAWRGSEMMGVSAQAARINVAVAVWEWPAYFDPAQVMKGIRLDMAEWRRPDPRTAPAKAKAVGLYMICTLAKHTAERKGYADALMLDWRGQVAECTGANIFFVKDGELHTPTPDCFLDGITRRTVIGLAQHRQIKVIERVIMPEEMAGFEQCFIVGTAAEVTPVSEIGPYRFEIGEITKTLRNDYLAEVLPKKAAA
jgi:branched-chain amino acid aminotransferase